MFYIERGVDVYGWYAEARRARYRAAFFMIENFYAEHATLLYRSVEDDVYATWIREVPGPGPSLRCPVEDNLAHELERLQSAFIDEWLFFADDPAQSAEADAFARSALPTFAFNVRSRRLGQLDQTRAVWTHRSPGTNGDILDFLHKCWRFSGKEIFLPEAGFAAPRQARREALALSSHRHRRH